MPPEVVMNGWDFPEDQESEDELDEDQSKSVKLEDRIVDMYAVSKFDREEKTFLPDGCIDKLVTVEAIVREYEGKYDCEEPIDLDLKSGSQEKKLTDFTFGQAKKVLAITIMTELSGQDLLGTMVRFMAKGLDDSKLPVEQQDLAKITKYKGSPWTKAKILRFWEQQWKFLAPVFTAEKFKIDLKPGHILPFIEKDSLIKEGAFGQVYQVDIHPAHQKDPVFDSDGSQAKLAIKEFMITTEDVNLRREVEAVWVSEVDTLDEISGLSHANIIQRIAAITRGKQRYLMFLWAKGGNLRDYWEKTNRKPVLTETLVKEVIHQIRGMAEALDKLHNWKKNQHYRHGDIKPENILIFPEDDTLIGTLKISDMGSAKTHHLATQLRPKTRDKTFSTVVYQAPEAVTRRLAPTSRLGDIWSMGCVTLEFIIWLLYGYEQLEKFNAGILGKREEATSFFVVDEREPASGVLTATVHPAVQSCLASLSQDSECIRKTALGDLLDIVSNKLLVVKLPERTESSIQSMTGENVSVTEDSGAFKSQQTFGNHRVTAAQYLKALDEVIEFGNNPRNKGYWCTGQKRENPTLPIPVSKAIPMVITGDRSKHLSPKWTAKPGRPNTATTPSPFLGIPSSVPYAQIQDYVRVMYSVYSNSCANVDLFFRPSVSIADITQELTDDWSYPVDNNFASRFLKDTRSTRSSDASPSSSVESTLCGRCKALSFWEPGFRFEDSWSSLEKDSKVCDFCRLRWEVVEELDRNAYSSITFERVESKIKLIDQDSPVLSIFRDSETPRPTQIQIGSPKIRKAGSEAHFNILRSWLKNCDENHHKTFKCQPPIGARLPTRLLDVGVGGSGTVRLHETQEKESFKYLALSHPWGKKPPYFTTNRQNIEKHKKSIAIADLPATFRHAIATTRELGFRYLWIDSLCIIQGPDGDFDQEAQRMEEVFSTASCTLAASSAMAQKDGFLNTRRGEQQNFVTFRPDGKAAFYVGPHLDDFQQHVLDGPLNQRGWVLQERLLAHRTIYFTDTQTYWECGEGVRCETLTRTENKLASFFGDPNFPEKISSNMTSKGQRIIFYEGLYKQYSRLDFTRWEDRPIAIAGLEKRLIKDLKTQGGFGVFDDGQSLLRRGLLWRRASKRSSLRRISFPPERNLIVPSWSWMAYEGEIDYLNLPFGGVDWETDTLGSPWMPNASQVYHTIDRTGVIDLDGVAREFDVPENQTQELTIFYDIPKTVPPPLKCVVMGIGKEGDNVNTNDARHYVLFITAKGGQPKIYERVGVGYMPGRFMNQKGPGDSARVKIR